MGVVGIESTIAVAVIKISFCIKDSQPAEPTTITRPPKHCLIVHLKT